MYIYITVRTDLSFSVMNCVHSSESEITNCQSL